MEPIPIWTLAERLIHPLRHLGERALPLAHPPLRAAGATPITSTPGADRAIAPMPAVLTEELQALVDHTSAAIYIKDLAGRYRLVNQSCVNMFGLDRDAVLGKTDHELFPAAIADAIRRDDHAVLETLQPLEREEALPMAHGETIFLSVKFALTGADGRAYALCGVSTDITERRLAERALERIAHAVSIEVGGAFFSSLVRHLAETLDMDYAMVGELIEPGRIRTIANYGRGAILPNFEYDLAGTPCEDVVGRDTAIFSKGVAERFPSDTVLSEMGIESYIGTPLWDSNSQPLGVLVVMGTQPLRHNVTIAHPLQTIFAVRAAAELQRKRADDRLRRQALDLEERVRERTARLAEMNDALEAFAYSASHDLRTPLQTTQILAQLLQKEYAGRLDGTARELIAGILRSVSDMDRLVRSLLTYSRVTGADLALEPIALSDVVAEQLGRMALLVTETGAQVTVSEPLPWVRGDRVVLGQVLLNLLTNAVKFVEEGVRPRIRVRSEPAAAGARIWIEDNGIGVAPADRERIFRAFERLHHSDRFPGSGIGLAIVRRGVERLGGRCGVESQPGRGSRFWIELPAA
jgi:PAS domain S-box-containing protein